MDDEPKFENWQAVALTPADALVVGRSKGWEFVEVLRMSPGVYNPFSFVPLHELRPDARRRYVEGLLSFWKELSEEDS